MVSYTTVLHAHAKHGNIEAITYIGPVKPLQTLLAYGQRFLLMLIRDG